MGRATAGPLAGETPGNAETQTIRFEVAGMEITIRPKPKEAQ